MAYRNEELHLLPEPRIPEAAPELRQRLRVLEERLQHIYERASKPEFDHDLMAQYLRGYLGRDYVRVPT